MNIEKSTVNSLFFALGYVVVFFILQLFLVKIDFFSTYPDAYNLRSWDAGWYYSIVENGYKFQTDKQDNSGFFILLSWLWKYLRLGTWGVCIMNLVFYAIGFAIFNSIYKIKNDVQLLWMTIPSFYFAWLPYTEALFILLVSICFLGIIKQKRYLIWTSLFLLSLTRPTVTILVPAFLITEVIVNGYKSWLSSLKVYAINYLIPLLLGLITFICYQYYCTGVWFAYFIQQEKHWGHKFAVPTFPLASITGPNLIWLNGIALFMGLVSLFVLIKIFMKWLRGATFIKDRLYILSALYFVGISLVTLFFNPIWGTFTTNVHDIHRYAFASPFFWVLLYRFTVVNTYNWKHIVIVILSANVVWSAFAHYMDMELFLYFNFATLLIVAYLLQSSKSWLKAAIVGVNLVLQLAMFQWFISGVYPG